VNENSASKSEDLERFTGALEFAAIKHVKQKRMGEDEEPYVNHLASVARLVADATNGADPNVVIAALLHDTLEDTETEYNELMKEFGADVADLVREVTDDKRLPKEVRKRQQVEKAPYKSPRAKVIKIVDKISNLESILHSPPVSWPAEGKSEYFRWAREVVEGRRGVNARLEAQFDDVYRRGRDCGIVV